MSIEELTQKIDQENHISTIKEMRPIFIITKLTQDSMTAQWKGLKTNLLHFLMSHSRQSPETSDI